MYVHRIWDRNFGCEEPTMGARSFIAVIVSVVLAGTATAAMVSKFTIDNRYESPAHAMLMVSLAVLYYVALGSVQNRLRVGRDRLLKDICIFAFMVSMAVIAGSQNGLLLEPYNGMFAPTSVSYVVLPLSLLNVFAVAFAMTLSVGILAVANPSWLTKLWIWPAVLVMATFGGGLLIGILSHADSAFNRPLSVFEALMAVFFSGMLVKSLRNTVGPGLVPRNISNAIEIGCLPFSGVANGILAIVTKLWRWIDPVGYDMCQPSDGSDGRGSGESNDDRR